MYVSVVNFKSDEMEEAQAVFFQVYRSTAGVYVGAGNDSAVCVGLCGQTQRGEIENILFKYLLS